MTTSAPAPAALAPLVFESPPSLPLVRALLHRPRPAPDVPLPALEALIQRAVLAEDPAYRRLCGFPEGGPLPVTLPHILAAPAHLSLATDPRMPIPAMGLVHVRNVIRAFRPIQPGTEAAIRCRIAGQRAVRSGVEVDILTEVTALAGGELLWREVSTALTRALPGGGGERVPEPPPLTRDLQLSAHWRLPADLGRRYAGVSGDYNPIHLYAVSARLFGFSRPIIHGMWALARCAAQLQLAAPCTLTIHFRRPVPLPSAVFFQADRAGRFEVTSARGGKRLLDGEVRADVEGD